jgi:arginase
MEIQIIQVPYDSGYKNLRLGNGPAHIINRGLKKRSQGGIHIDEVVIENRFPLEVGTTFQLAHALADRVREATQQGRFPLVLAGNCMSSIGTLAGLNEPVGVVWLDAHGDLNTPESTLSGFLDGMALATITGRCWGNLAATFPGFDPVPDRQVIILGARDFDPAERRLLDASAMTPIGTPRIRQAGVEAVLKPALQRICRFTPRIYLHIDLDVLDVSEARVNQFSCPGGLTLAELLDVVGFVCSHSSLAAAAITAYDPAFDEGDRALNAALEIIDLVCKLVGDSSAG